MKKCPKCGSEKITFLDYRGIKTLYCKDCGYDERDLYEEEFSEKRSQKQKREFTPYKAGGKDRSR